MSHTIIRALFETRLTNWASTRQQPLRVAYENVSFEPGPGETYLRCFMLPAETDSLDLEGAHTLFQGLFHVNVVSPAGVGPGEPSRIADELAELFPINLALSRDDFTVYVRSKLTVSRGTSDTASYTVPTRLTYRADQA